MGIGVIGLLAAVLFPVALSARDKRQRAICLSNLKQFALGVAMYADEDRAPTTNVTLVGFVQCLSNGVSSAKAYYCPGDRRPGARAEADFSKLTSMNISYSCVPSLLWLDAPDSIVALDRIYATASGSTWPTNGNHKGAGGNVLFNDGHAQWFNTLPSALKDKDGKQIVLSP